MNIAAVMPVVVVWSEFFKFKIIYRYLIAISKLRLGRILTEPGPEQRKGPSPEASRSLLLQVIFGLPPSFRFNLKLILFGAIERTATRQPNGGKFLSLRGPRTGTAAAGSTL